MRCVLLVALLAWVSFAAAGTTEEGLKWLAEKEEEEGVVKLDSGLLYKVIKSGDDGAPSPKADTPCSCHYRGTLTDGTEFDSSYKRGKPTEFAPNQVIAGWTEAMQLMKEGDKWELYIPSELAYGDSQRGEHITPGAVLVFELEILEVKLGDEEEEDDLDVADSDEEEKPKKKKKKKPKKKQEDHVVTLTDDNFDETVFGSKDAWMVEFYAPWCGHCKTLAPEWARAAKQLKEWSREGVSVKLAKVDATVEKASSGKFDVTSFPTIFSLRPGAEGVEDAEKYGGARDTQGIVNFAKELAEPILPPIEVQQLLSAVQLHKCRTNEPEDWDAEEDGAYEAEGEVEPHWCVVAFLPHILDDQADARNGRLEMLNALANNDRSLPVTLLWSEAGAQPELEKAMDLNFGFPALTAVSAAGDKYAVHSGEVSKIHLQKYFLPGLKGGWANIRDLVSVPDVKEVEQWDGNDGAVEEEEEFSLEDIMGEELG